MVGIETILTETWGLFTYLCSPGKRGIWFRSLWDDEEKVIFTLRREADCWNALLQLI